MGGAGLAAEFTRRGLIDEYRLFVAPVLLGGGTPYFPPGVRADLKLEETRTFADGQVVYLRLSAALGAYTIHRGSASGETTAGRRNLTRPASRAYSAKCPLMRVRPPPGGDGREATTPRA